MHFLLIFIISLIFSCSSSPVKKGMPINSQTEFTSESIYLDTTLNSNSDTAIQNQLQALHQLPRQTYKIAPGDKFNIFIYGENDLSESGVIVKPDGTLTIKLAGEIDVLGKTILEATQETEKVLAKYLLAPKVSLSIAEMKSARFTVIGKVNKVGTFPLENNSRLTDAIATAGGLSVGIFQNNTVELADLEHAYMTRNGVSLPINFAKAIREGNALHNIPLVDGDYIFIPSAMNKEIFVIGEVLAPGYIGFQENRTLTQAIAYVRGFRETANDEVLVIRGGLNHPRVYRINMSKVLEGQAQDILLQPNDIVFVPRSRLGAWSSIATQIIPMLEVIQRGVGLQKSFQ